MLEVEPPGPADGAEFGLLGGVLHARSEKRGGRPCLGPEAHINSTDLTVTPATLDSIEVTPTESSVAKGTSLQFTAMGIFSDSSKQDLTTQVTWSSSDDSIFTVSNAAGSQGLADGFGHAAGGSGAAGIGDKDWVRHDGFSWAAAGTPARRRAFPRPFTVCPGRAPPAVW